jgi:hypothetical protein
MHVCLKLLIYSKGQACYRTHRSCATFYWAVTTIYSTLMASTVYTLHCLMETRYAMMSVQVASSRLTYLRGIKPFIATARYTVIGIDSLVHFLSASLPRTATKSDKISSSDSKLWKPSVAG